MNEENYSDWKVAKSVGVCLFYWVAIPIVLMSIVWAWASTL